MLKYYFIEFECYLMNVLQIHVIIYVLCLVVGCNIAGDWYAIACYSPELL